MRTETTLNLLVIDDDQLYAEGLINLLKAYYSEVNLGFLDDKEELLKSLRQSWDVLVFGRAYDLSFTDVVGIIQQHNIELPLIALMSDELAEKGRNSDGLPVVIDGSMVQALVADRETQVVMAIRLLHDNLRSRRQINSLQQVLAESEQRANLLIKNSKSAVAYIDQGIHIFANDPYLEMFNFESMADIIGMPVIDLIAGSDNIKDFKHFLRQFDKGNREQVEFNSNSKTKDGHTFEVKLQLATATLEGEPVTQIIIQQNNSSADINKQLAAVERIDSLTGLTNRLGFEERLESLHQQVVKDKSNAGLLYIQLDNMGKISSSLGLEGVDATIKQVGASLNTLLDKLLGNSVEDYPLSRFSDTSFALLVKDASTQTLKDLAERLRLAISELLINVGERTLSTTASIGVVKMDQNAPEPRILLARALESIHHIGIETSNLGDAYHFYDLSKHATDDDSALAEYLVNAITNNRFELLYQPIYDITLDRSDFFEVYLRLPLGDADNTVLTPSQFMSVAKSHNLLRRIDRWLLINASKQLNEVRKTHPEARLLIPLTSESLIDKKLASVASQIIKAVGGPAGALTIEFNEQDVRNHLTVAKSQFAALDQVNCRTGINNFGSTTKCFDTAEFVQPYTVRIAQSYVEDIHTDNNLDTVKSIITGVNKINIDVLMPYIEDAATMSVSWSVGARYLQGDYLEKPSHSINIL